jgi:hypothetical protein
VTRHQKLKRVPSSYRLHTDRSYALLVCREGGADVLLVLREWLIGVLGTVGNQRLVAYWDTMPDLPVPANAEVGTYSINNGVDRLIRL